MITVNFNAYASYITDSLTQWDKNQKLSVSGLNLSVAPEVHFSNADMDRAIVRQAALESNIVNVDIPNSLLQMPLRIYAHIGIYEGETFKVIETVEIPVKPKKRPLDYIIEDSDEEIYSFKALENALKNKADTNKVNARIDNIIAHNNDTEGNTELIDMRVGADGKTYNTAGEAMRDQVSKMCEFRTVDFSVSGYYGGNATTGKVEILPSDTNYSTVPIKLSDFLSIKYTGKMGGTVATWLDKYNRVISQSVDSFETTLVDVDIKSYAPDNAECVVLASRNSTHTSPPSKTPTVKVAKLKLERDINDVRIVKNIPLIYYGYWVLLTKEFVPSVLNKSTDYIDVEHVSSILYTGLMGGTVATWFDTNKEFIEQTTISNETMLIDYNVMSDCPKGAKYVVLSSRTLNHSTPPTVTPKVSIIIDNISHVYNGDSVDFIGDGVTDETDNLIKALTANEVNLPCNAKILISKSIVVNSETVKKINGNNATIIVNGDFTALKVTGKCVGNANPNHTDNNVITDESNTIIENLRFTSTNEKYGTAIELNGCFKTIINKCNIFKMKNGVKLVNCNRDLIISNNQIYALYNYGLWFTNSCDNHQLNIVGNHISYCKYCIYYDNCIEIANHQLTGNDIEISDFPADFKTITRAILIESGGNAGQLSEFEITGNTVQGHYTSETLIEILGGANRNIRDMSIVGNHISNSSKNAIVLDKVKNITIDANTHKETTGQLFKVSNAENITITSNVADQCGGLLDANLCNIDNLVLSNNVVQCSDNAITINVPNGNLTSSIISGNVLNASNGSIVITPDSADRVIVFGNISRNGAYNIADTVANFNNY